MPVSVGEAAAAETLRGTVERVIYRSETYHVFSLRLGKKGSVVVTGHAPRVMEGEKVTVRGKWTRHKKYGDQFAMETLDVETPATEKGLIAYLGSGLIKGIGPVMAKRIVSHFGQKALEIIKETPERLHEVPGIGKYRAKQILRGIEEYAHIERIMMALRERDVSTAYAMRIYKHFGTEAVRILDESPYRLTEVHGIGFLVADRIAKKLGVPHNDPERIQAGLLYVLSESSAKGHVCLSQSEIREEAKRILGCSEQDVDRALLAALERGNVSYRRVDGVNWYYLPALYGSEQGIVSHIRRIRDKAFSPVGGSLDDMVDQAARGLGIQFAPGQARAVALACRGGVCVITGGPGTGKTTITRAIVDIYERQGKRVLLAAPTGRAAKRLAESTGRDACTVHRLLEWDAQNHRFARNEKNPLSCDLLVVDESSMLDVYLAFQLLRAVPSGASVLFVGDVDQLPSVGPGRVLGDLIESGEVAVARLTEIFRQAQESLIVTNSHLINRGQMPIMTTRSDRDPDMYFLNEEDPELLRNLLVDLVCRRIPAKYGYDPLRDIQLLSPMQRGVLGVRALNREIQDRINPERPGVPSIKYFGTSYRLGDKVMQIRNNYDKEVFNGDIGIVVHVDSEDNSLVVEYEGVGRIHYDHAELDELVLSYAVTVHKSQGSEYPVVVMPVHTQHYIMLQRNLLYTGVTRGKELVILAGTPKALRIAVRNNTAPKRYSHLMRLLRERTSVPGRQLRMGVQI